MGRTDFAVFILKTVPSDRGMIFSYAQSPSHVLLNSFEGKSGARVTLGRMWRMYISLERFRWTKTSTILQTPGPVEKPSCSSVNRRKAAEPALISSVRSNKSVIKPCLLKTAIGGFG